MTLIMFGDGQQALYYDEKNPSNNREGVKVQKILVIPSQELISKYNLTEEHLNIVTDDGKQGLWMEYPVMQIEWLSRSIQNAVVFIFCAFDGKPTNIMRKYDLLLEYVNQQDKEINLLRIQVSGLQQLVQDTSSNQIEVFRSLKEWTDMVEPGGKDEEEGG